MRYAPPRGSADDERACAYVEDSCASWIHELGRRDHGNAFPLGQRGTVRAIGALSDRVLVSAPEVRDALRGDGLPAAKLRDLPYAIEAPATRAAAPSGPPRLVITGRVRPSKGQGDAVAALAHLPAEIELDVVGDGTPEDLGALARLADELGIRGRVHPHGGVLDPGRFLDRATLALMCSRDEAFGRVTVEAMVHGRAVVGARAGGTARLIEDRLTGRLHPPGDPAALATVVRELLGDDEQRERIAAAGRAFALASFGEGAPGGGVPGGGGGGAGRPSPGERPSEPR